MKSIDHLNVLMETSNSQDAAALLPINLSNKNNVTNKTNNNGITGSLVDEVELIPYRISQITKLAKSLPKQKQGPFLKEHPLSVVLTQIGKQMTGLTGEIVSYQQLRAQLDLVKQQLQQTSDSGTTCTTNGETKGPEADPDDNDYNDNVINDKMWESERGGIMLASTEILLLLVQKESDDDNSIKPSSLFKMNECKKMFLTFAI